QRAGRRRILFPLRNETGVLEYRNGGVASPRDSVTQYSITPKQLHGPAWRAGITARQVRLKLLKGYHASTFGSLRNAQAVDQGRFNRHRNLRPVHRRTV